MTSPMLEKMARAIYEAAPIWSLGDLTGDGPSKPIAYERLWETQPDYIEGINRQARAALTTLLQPDEGTIEAMAKALGEWRKTLDRDEAMMRSYMTHDRKFIASATPAEKHAIRFQAAIQSILGETK